MRTVYREQKQEKMAALKEKTITLRLSDVDYQELCKKAGSVGLAVSELLESFIGDLVGIRSNGSDERMHAEAWFNRCCSGTYPDKTFLRYLIEYNRLDNLIAELEDREDAIRLIETTEKEIRTGVIEGRDGNYTWKDLINSDKKPAYQSQEDWEASQREYIEQEQAELAYAEREIDEVWADFLSWTDEENLSFEEEIKKLQNSEFVKIK